MRKTLKLKTLILIAEMNDGTCYQVDLSKRQDTAIQSVLAALPEPLKLVDNPLSMTIDHSTAKPEED